MSTSYIVGGCCSYGRRNTTIDCVITRASCGCGNICDLLLFLYYYRGVRGVLFTLYCTWWILFIDCRWLYSLYEYNSKYPKYSSIPSLDIFHITGSNYLPYSQKIWQKIENSDQKTKQKTSRMKDERIHILYKKFQLKEKLRNYIVKVKG